MEMNYLALLTTLFEFILELFFTLSFVRVHVEIVAFGQRRFLHLLRHHQIHHRVEHLRNIRAVFGRDFEDGHFQFFRQVDQLVRLDHPFGVQIYLVARDDSDVVVAHMSSGFHDPVSQLEETIAVGYIVHENNCVCALVIAGREGSELFLSGGVPEVQLDVLAVVADDLGFEVYAYGREEILDVEVVEETDHD